MIDVCDVCGTLSDNCTHYESMIICDVCEDDFDGMAEANDACAELGAYDEDQEQSHE
ncbi:hypothetical protein [Acinetobacter chinensis]|uniref:hypothetical protein n=1 Tax=Acinetobacter chinensis TaxID=2004650 RepID=UPI00135BF9E8|nr:hypothetical protein [Acinetobacter chinensis]